MKLWVHSWRTLVIKNTNIWTRILLPQHWWPKFFTQLPSHVVGQMNRKKVTVFIKGGWITWKLNVGETFFFKQWRNIATYLQDDASARKRAATGISSNAANFTNWLVLHPILWNGMCLMLSHCLLPPHSSRPGVGNPIPPVVAVGWGNPSLLEETSNFRTFQYNEFAANWIWAHSWRAPTREGRLLSSEFQDLGGSAISLATLPNNRKGPRHWLRNTTPNYSSPGTSQL